LVLEGTVVATTGVKYSGTTIATIGVNIGAHGDRLRAETAEWAIHAAKDGESWGKSHHVWKNDTGLAERSLRGQATIHGDAIGVTFAQTARSRRWLEIVPKLKRFAIIPPMHRRAIASFGPWKQRMGLKGGGG
jgi:hypothetical protein